MKHLPQLKIVGDLRLDCRTWLQVRLNMKQATLTVRVFRAQGKGRWHIVPAEDIGPFGTVGEMRHALSQRFDAFAVRALCRRGSIPRTPHRDKLPCPESEPTLWHRIVTFCAAVL